MAKRMDTHVELEMAGVRNGAKVQTPNVKQNIADYLGGYSKDLRNNLKEWKIFDVCPAPYYDFDFFTDSPVVEARRELADPEFLPTVKQPKLMTPSSRAVPSKNVCFFGNMRACACV
jgi:hypothetical protein